MNTEGWKPTHIITTPSGVHELELVYKLDDDSWMMRRCGVPCGDWYDPRDLKPITSEPPSVSEETKSPTAPHGGPSDYYDFNEGFCTANDIMEFLASDRWGGDALHMKDIFKACFRWGKKEGTSKEYDAKKIIYSAARLLRQYSGQEETRAYLQSLLDDKQFGGKS